MYSHYHLLEEDFRVANFRYSLYFMNMAKTKGKTVEKASGLWVRSKLGQSKQSSSRGCRWLVPWTRNDNLSRLPRQKESTAYGNKIFMKCLLCCIRRTPLTSVFSCLLTKKLLDWSTAWEEILISLQCALKWGKGKEQTRLGIITLLDQPGG